MDVSIINSHNNHLKLCSIRVFKQFEKKKCQQQNILLCQSLIDISFKLAIKILSFSYITLLIITTLLYEILR